MTQERTREKQRAEKLLEDAQIKLSSGISDIFGASGRDMLAALIGGQRNPHELAGLARKNVRVKTSVLQEALTGHFTDHHAFMPGMVLARIDAPTTQIDTLTTRIGEAIAPYAAQVAQVDEIPGIGVTAARDPLAEIGTDMPRFPTPGHLVYWAKFAPKPVSPPTAAKPPLSARATPGSAAPSARPPPPPSAPRPSYAHCKFIGYAGDPAPLFAAAGLTELADDGFVDLNDHSAADFLATCAALRFWSRQASIAEKASAAMAPARKN